MPRRAGSTFAVVALTVGLGTPSATAQRIYWTDSGCDRIQRSELDGSNVEDLVVTGLASPQGIALDAAGGKIYWVDAFNDTIQRANLDGSQVEDLVYTGLSAPRDIAINVAVGKMYWTDSGTDKIQRANLDGTNVQDVISIGLLEPWGIAIDPAGKIYWTDAGTCKIQRADLDGTDIEDLVTTGLANPREIVLDPVGGWMYFTDQTRITLEGVIERADLDGVNIETVVMIPASSRPVGIDLDVSAGKMYWTDGFKHKVQRANLDGSDIEDIVTDLQFPAGIALDLLTIYGDCDDDGLITLTDYGWFFDCATGPGENVLSECDCAEANDDDHVDLIDFGILQRAFAGP
jgi:DNA-binding beta-propeller fold protein YncE